MKDIINTMRFRILVPKGKSIMILKRNDIDFEYEVEDRSYITDNKTGIDQGILGQEN
jgi:hypothetical protein